MTNSAGNETTSVFKILPRSRTHTKHQVAQHEGQRGGRPGCFHEQEQDHPEAGNGHVAESSQMLSAANGAIPARAVRPEHDRPIAHDHERQVEQIRGRTARESRSMSGRKS